ncbi:MAG: PLP-dependent aminotransferase family protein [Desulfurococcales archaeon]|nr:PLP-dependent aminotransferase family protein [Desulfurococcales archaeon]
MSGLGGEEARKFVAKRVQGIRASEIRELLKLTEGRDVISFAGGLPDPETFPKEELAEVAREVILQRGEQALQYSPTKGVTEFRRVLQGFLRDNNVKVTVDDDVIVTTGSQEALYLVGKSLVDPGDVVFTESPTYLAALNVFRQFGARFISAPIDEDGMKTEILEERVKKAAAEGLRLKLIYTIPTSQNPGGVTMSLERRKHLLEIAERYDLLVVEDDPYSFFTFEPVDVVPLKTLDKSGRVIYLGSLSKILAPGLRIGWALGPSWAITTLELAKQAVDLHSSTLSQYVAMEAIRRGLVEKTVGKARRIYKAKRDMMLEAMEEYFPEGSSWTRPVGGLFIFAYAPEGIDTKALLPEAVERGVAYVPGASFFPEGGGENTMRLNFSYPTPVQIREGIRRLGLLLKEKAGR